jgi:hypothetical protein
MIKLFKKVGTDDDFEFWTADDLKINDLISLKYAEIS